MTARLPSRDIIPSALLAGITITAAAALPLILCYLLCRRALDRYRRAPVGIGLGRHPRGGQATGNAGERPLRQACQRSSHVVIAAPTQTPTRSDSTTLPRQDRLLPTTSGA
jgi:hypothetical protein